MLCNTKHTIDTLDLMILSKQWLLCAYKLKITFNQKNFPGQEFLHHVFCLESPPYLHTNHPFVKFGLVSLVNVTL